MHSVITSEQKLDPRIHSGEIINFIHTSGGQGPKTELTNDASSTEQILINLLKRHQGHDTEIVR